MDPTYAIRDTSAIYSPALIFFKDLIRRNIARAIELAGQPARLRPHVKTHKTREIVGMELEAGITRHKCATLAEAEMLASCGAADVLVAFPLVGPNCGRLARLVAAYPRCRFCVTADHPVAVEALARALNSVEREVDVLVDIDLGMHRTGMAAGPQAVELYRLIARLAGLRPGGIHAYDGHNRQESLDERRSAVLRQIEPVLNLRNTLVQAGLPVPRVVVGGTPTFPIFCHLDVPGLECSPGTLVLHDHGYGSRYPDMSGFAPAALLLTRVVSRPTPTRVTFDLGTKAVASDPPAGSRLVLRGLPDCEAVLHNEEHLVIETTAADRFHPGDEALAIPTHVCPTCALHRHAHIVDGGEVCGTWEIAARDRVLTV
jgi:D-serine deaminase-like pyridoxal phosphate-dependent protein